MRTRLVVLIYASLVEVRFTNFMQHPPLPSNILHFWYLMPATSYSSICLSMAHIRSPLASRDTKSPANSRGVLQSSAPKKFPLVAREFYYLSLPLPLLFPVPYAVSKGLSQTLLPFLWYELFKTIFSTKFWTWHVKIYIIICEISFKMLFFFLKRKTV